MNAYACDFYLHSIKQALVHDNGLKEGDAYHLLKDFKVRMTGVIVTFAIVFFS